jgi:hypothetical protein
MWHLYYFLHKMECHIQASCGLLRGSASTSNTEILQGLQNKVLRTIVNALWYDPNEQLHTDLGLSPVREEITNISHKYKDKLTAHPNELATTLLNDEVEPRRPKRFKPADLMKQHIQMLYIYTLKIIL